MDDRDASSGRSLVDHIVAPERTLVRALRLAVVDTDESIGEISRCTVHISISLSLSLSLSLHTH